MNLYQYKAYAEAASHKKKADTVFKNARIVDVVTGRIIESSLAVKDGIILGISDSYEGNEVVDLNGAYITPGFIDAHIHLESTMVSPAEIVATASNYGTTTFIVDPHEAANVSGAAGIDYILDQTEGSEANVYVMMPSCVPATPIDDNGATFLATDMMPYLNNPRILGLGEVMDDQAVLNADPTMYQKLCLFHKKMIDGHAPFLSDEGLNTYCIAGIMTDHEASSFDYALKEAERGIHVHIREGSAAHNCADIVEGIVREKINTDCFSFCTDDKHIEDIMRDGHIGHNIRIAISKGMDPIDAVKIATINTARTYGLKNLGALTPGAQADLVIIGDLEKVDIKDVYYKGRKIVKGKMPQLPPCPAPLKNTVLLEDLAEDKFVLPIDKDEIHVIKLDPAQITTTDLVEHFDKTDNFVPHDGFLKVAAVERHKNTGKIGVAVATGYGIKNGAIASSVSHDSHNIIVIGDNDRDMALAVNALIESQGGYSLVEDGKVYDVLPLPIMGLMSDAGFESVNEKLADMKKKAASMGVLPEIDPFITLSFMALPVIPELRITPRGLFKLDDTGLNPV